MSQTFVFPAHVVDLNSVFLQNGKGLIHSDGARSEVHYAAMPSAAYRQALPCHLQTRNVMSLQVVQQ